MKPLGPRSPRFPGRWFWGRAGGPVELRRLGWKPVAGQCHEEAFARYLETVEIGEEIDLNKNSYNGG